MGSGCLVKPILDGFVTRRKGELCVCVCVCVHACVAHTLKIHPFTHQGNTHAEVVQDKRRAGFKDGLDVEVLVQVLEYIKQYWHGSFGGVQTEHYGTLRDGGLL